MIVRYRTRLIVLLISLKINQRKNEGFRKEVQNMPLTPMMQKYMETKEEYNYLRTAGAGLAQGYYLGRPA